MKKVAKKKPTELKKVTKAAKKAVGKKVSKKRSYARTLRIEGDAKKPKKNLRELLQVFVWRGYTLEDVVRVAPIVASVVYDLEKFHQLPLKVQHVKTGLHMRVEVKGKYVQVTNLGTKAAQEEDNG